MKLEECLIFLVNMNSIKIPIKSVIGQRLAYLICSERCYSDLSESNQADFKKIYVLDDFGIESVSDAFLDITSLNSQFSYKIITNDECCNDICSQLNCKFLDADYEDNSGYFQNKELMKKKFKDFNLPTYIYQRHIPSNYAQDKAVYISGVIGRLSLPLVCKPIDSTGSQGVAIIHSEADFEQWCEDHYAVDNYELCEYVFGDLYHCDSIVVDGKIEYTRIGKNSFPCHQISEGKNIGTFLVPIDSDIYTRIQNLNKKLITAFNPRNGATHMEVFEKLNGELVLLEVADRPPGGEMRWMYMTADNVDIEAAHFNLRIGNKFDSLYSIAYGVLNVAWACFPCPEGRISKLNIPSIRSESNINWRVNVGDETIASANLDTPKAGVIRLVNSDYTAIEEDYEVIKSFLFVDVN